jgi:phospholipid/cholesterol/gamma-HCH transport system substrate-binding protein
MNPSPQRQAVIVGLFVTVALFILAGGILTIGDLNDTFTHKVVVRAVFDEVSGLKAGDNIWFSGLKVGTVKKLTFVAGSKVEVLLNLDQEATPFIHNNALAKLGSDGLIGNRIVVIYEGTAEAPAVKNGDELKIGTTVSTEEIMTMLQTNNKNLLAITTDLKGITAKIAAGEGTVGKLLSDDTLYTHVTDAVQTLQVASTNARQMTASLATFSAKLNKPGSLFNDLATDQTTYASLTGTVASLKQVGERAGAVVDSLGRSLDDPSTPVGVLLHDKPAGGDLRSTLDNLERGSLLLNDDLEALQHNFLFRGFFKKRAKEEAKAAAEAAGN